MSPLKGHTLGQRQKYYNELVREAIANKTSDIPKINYNHDDIDNMMKIDLAGHERHVSYILEVLKCEDMLYVSRAIHKSTWLITDPQYAHIINPEYLHTELFPHMKAKAVTKLMLHIRLYLKDENRAEGFFNYVHEKNSKAAMHWLQNCSIQFIKTVINDATKDIPLKLLIRLIKKSIEVLHVYIKSRDNCDLTNVFNNTKFLLKNRQTAEAFLQMLNSTRCDESVKFNSKHTSLLMKACPQRIKDNFQEYHTKIDLKTFAKLLKEDEIKPFLIRYSIYTRNFEALAPFLVRLPRDDNMNLLETLYNVKADNTESCHKVLSNTETFFYTIEGEVKSLENIYRWYEFLPFNPAFQDIKMNISEKCSNEKLQMLMALVTCAKNNIQHMKTVLQYYHENYFNETYKVKIAFITHLLKNYDTFRFENDTWNMLNDLFYSLEVYTGLGKDKQECIKSIVIRNVLCDAPISTTIEENIDLDTFNDIKRKFNPHEQNKLFDYLFNLSMAKLCKQNIYTESGMHEAINSLQRIWNLLTHWNKKDTHYIFVINKIAEFIDVAKASPWAMTIQRPQRRKRRKNKYKKHNYWIPKIRINFSIIYSMVGMYRKYLFENSLKLRPCEEVCLNALKHDPGLLWRCKSELDILRCDNEVSLTKFLTKLRVYWPKSSATEWADTNISYLRKSQGHRALVRGIITVLPHNQLKDFIKLHAPDENKIKWKEIDEIELNVQKNIAKNMHIARPQLPANIVLWYIKGDFLQYGLLSLHSMYYNLSMSDIPKYVDILLNSPVSVQKHGIRLLFVKSNSKDIINKSSIIWNRTRNASIRAILFKSLFYLLCKETEDMTIKSIFSVLSMFIDDLNYEENRSIYHTLATRLCDVPISVRGQCFQKAYIFFMSLSLKADYELYHMVVYAVQVIEHLDSEFVENTLLGSIHDLITHGDTDRISILSAYILCSKDPEIQIQKHNRLLRPFVETYFCKKTKKRSINKSGLLILLTKLLNDLQLHVFTKKNVMPLELFGAINIELSTGLVLSRRENYIISTLWDLTTSYLKVLAAYIKCNPSDSWVTFSSKSLKDLAEICVQRLTQDVNERFLSIYILFAEALQTLFKIFGINDVNYLDVLNHMIDSEKSDPVYLLALKMLPPDCEDQNNDLHNKKDNIKRKIYCFRSDEVTLHYFHKFRNKYDVDELSDSSDSNINIVSEKCIVKTNTASYLSNCNIV